MGWDIRARCRCLERGALVVSDALDGKLVRGADGEIDLHPDLEDPAGVLWDLLVQEVDEGPACRHEGRLLDHLWLHWTHDPSRWQALIAPWATEIPGLRTLLCDKRGVFDARACVALVAELAFLEEAWEEARRGPWVLAGPLRADAPETWVHREGETIGLVGPWLRVWRASAEGDEPETLFEGSHFLVFLLDDGAGTHLARTQRLTVWQHVTPAVMPCREGLDSRFVVRDGALWSRQEPPAGEPFPEPTWVRGSIAELRRLLWSAILHDGLVTIG